MKSIIRLIPILLCVFFVFNVQAQINFDFKINSDTANWKGGKSNQSLLSWTNNDFLQIQVDGGFWAVASYEPAGGVIWDFDKTKVIVVKVQKKFGDLYVKFFDKGSNKNYKMKDPLPLMINGTTQLIHVVAFENYANDYPDLQTGLKQFTNIQIAHEYVSSGQQIQIDWIKSFPTIDAAYEYVGPLLDGVAITNQQIFRVIRRDDAIIISGMEVEKMVSVYDSFGRLIAKSLMLNGEISNLHKGLYFVKIDSEIIKIII